MAIKFDAEPRFNLQQTIYKDGSFIIGAHLYVDTLPVEADYSKFGIPNFFDVGRNRWQIITDIAVTPIRIELRKPLKPGRSAIQTALPLILSNFIFGEKGIEAMITIGTIDTYGTLRPYRK